MPYLEITEVVLIHCNIVNSEYQQESRVLYTFVLINHLVNDYIFNHFHNILRLFDVLLYFSLTTSETKCNC